jgi:anti-sigma factor RsiW
MADWSKRADAEPGRNGEHISDALLSAYISEEIEDGQVARTVGEHLASCEACRRKVNELRAVVALLAELPEPEPPRSFRLTPEMVPVRPLRRDRGYVRLQQSMRWAAALAAVLLLMVFGTDIVLYRTAVPEATTMSKAVPGTAERFSEAPAASDDGRLGVGSAGEAGSNETPAAEPATSGETAPAGGAGSSAEPAPAVSTFQAPAASPAPAADQATPAIAMQPESKRTGWALSSGRGIAELGLALLIVWLLAISIALPRLYPWLRGRGGG